MAVIFGVALGLLYGVLFAGVVSTVLPSMVRERPQLLARLGDGPRARVFVTALLYVGILYWGLIGAALGGYFLLAEALAPDGGLLSPNLAYTLSVLLVTLLAAGATAAFVKRSGRIQAWLLTAAFGALFGWLLPLLAA